MLDRLPPELLLRVAAIASTSPPPDLDRGHAASTSTLCALSAVCHTTRHAAQEALRRKAVLRSNRHAKAFVEQVEEDGDGELKKAVRQLSIEDGALDEVVDVLGKLERLEEVQVVRDSVRWEELQRTKAPSLVLYDVKPSPVSSPFHLGFDHLVQLSLDLFHLTSVESRTFFTPSTLPNLRALSIGQLCHPDHGQLRTYPPVLSSELVQQLDMLQIQQLNGNADAFFDRDEDEPELQDLTSVLLTESDWFSDRQPDVLTLATATMQHLRVLSSPFSPTNGKDSHGFPARYAVLVRLARAAERLDRLLEAVRTSSHTLKSLHLPVELRYLPPDIPSSFSSSCTPFGFPSHLYPTNPSAKRDELLALCEKAGIEVLWHDESAEGRMAVSGSFWRYAKALKEKREAERVREEEAEAVRQRFARMS